MKQTTTFTLLTQVLNLWHNETELIIAKQKLSIPEFTLLASTHYICNVNKLATQTDICTHAGIKQMNASILLRKLQNRKFLSRKEHPTDTRAKTVELTQTGMQVTIDILEDLNKISSAFFQIPKNKEDDFINKLQEIKDSKK